jgi:filamentous hemagglutinin family protein
MATMLQSGSRLGLGLMLLVCAIAPVQAQVIPDGTSASRVSSLDQRNFTIEDGRLSGANLFHSFSEFSVPTGGAAIFNQPLDVQNIFTRVTGSNISAIDGLIQANGTANLFLLNPNGILFGPQATLNIGGSFSATTASQIDFADGTTFSATNPTPLLTMSVPIGLQMGRNPGTITIQGSGHQLTTQNPLLAPYFPTGPAAGLRVQPGQSIALVGGDLNFVGGVVTAPSGRVDLASLGPNARIPIMPTGALGPADATRQDIYLSQKALIDVNALNSGSIHVQSRNLTLDDGSLLWAQNRSPDRGGDIRVNATGRLQFTGAAPDFSSVSSIINESIAGAVGDIDIVAPEVVVRDGANIINRTFGFGPGGDLRLQATNLTIDGTVPFVPALFSNIATYTNAPAPAGNVRINAQNIAILGGANLAALTVNSGRGGDISINADTVTVSGLSPAFAASSISVPTIGGTGNAGNLTLNTRQLSIVAGGSVGASSFGAGNAGRVQINASESVELVGLRQIVGNIYQTNISSAVAPATEPYITQFQLQPLFPTASSGDLSINTPYLLVRDGGFISVENFGSGIAGNINIAADRLTVQRGSSITANSSSGQGGNLQIQSDRVLLNQTARISTAAGGQGDGGNLKIQSPVIIGWNNSDITANAFQGMGGKINITTQGLFGLKFRNQLTPENDITASSEFGVNGIVQVNTIGVDPNAGLAALPIDIIDPSQKIAAGCAGSQAGSFVITGRGGIPGNPTQSVIADHPWTDLRNPIARLTDRPANLAAIPSALTEATNWQFNAQHQPELIASNAHRVPLQASSATCAQP